MSPLGLPAEIIEAQLQELHYHFNAGDRNALIKAIRFCGDEQVVMPEWVVDAFFKATNRWYSLEVKTLGEAFAIEYRKGTHFNSLRKRRKIKHGVYNRVTELHARGEPIGAALFERVGEEFNIGKTLAEDYYYDARKATIPIASKMLLAPYKHRKK